MRKILSYSAAFNGKIVIRNSNCKTLSKPMTGSKSGILWLSGPKSAPMITVALTVLD